MGINTQFKAFSINVQARCKASPHNQWSCDLVKLAETQKLLYYLQRLTKICSNWCVLIFNQSFGRPIKQQAIVRANKQKLKNTRAKYISEKRKNNNKSNRCKKILTSLLEFKNHNYSHNHKIKLVVELLN